MSKRISIVAVLVALLLGGNTGYSQSKVKVRRDISALSKTDIDALKKAVKIMQDRKPEDPTSWLYQANIHGTTDKPLQPGWAQCQHGSYFFFSWHRMYLYFFERILRDASGNPDLALPYWNYSQPSQRALPEAFRLPADAGQNPLFVAARNDGINDGAQLPASAVSYASAFARTEFYSTNGSGLSLGGEKVNAPGHYLRPHGLLERQPHDAIHDLVGGDGWMGDPDTAANDPIFWLHHANIDRLWKRWLDQGGGRQNPVGDGDWMTNVKFSFFDENKKQIDMSGKDILDTVSQLDYRYDDDPPPNIVAMIHAQVQPKEVKPPMPAKTLYKLDKKTDLDLLTTVNLPLSDEVHEGVKKAREEKRSLVLAVENVQAAKNPGVYYEVYLDLPKNEEPSPDSIYYVGNLSFFGEKGHGNHSPRFDITHAVDALKKANAWDEKELRVTFVMRGLIPPDGRKAQLKQGKRAEFSGITIITH